MRSVLSIAFLTLLAACGETASGDVASVDERGDGASVVCPQSGEGVTIVSPWVRATANANGMTAAYFDVCNNGNEPIKIVAAETPAAGVVELHETTRSAEGVVSMSPISSIEVASGAGERLAPGGKHLMLMRLAGAIDAGDSVALSLKLSNGATIEVTAPAKAMDGGH
ncbi:MAG: copper chaperone PCu(A)C [Pseudomonadota bacterium]